MRMQPLTEPLTSKVKGLEKGSELYRCIRKKDEIVSSMNHFLQQQSDEGIKTITMHQFFDDAYFWFSSCKERMEATAAADPDVLEAQ